MLARLSIAAKRIARSENVLRETGGQRAPYRKWHSFAEKIERMLAFVLKVNWKKYSDEVMSL